MANRYRVAALLLATLLLLLPVGCSVATREAPPLRVVLLYDQGGPGDCCFNDMAREGVKRAAKEFGRRIDTKTFQVSSYGDNRELLLELQGQSRVDLVIAVSYDFTRSVQLVAPRYPETHFVVIDGYLPGLSPEGNVTCVTFREQEGSYLVGAIAALLTKTGSIGFIGAVKNPVIERFEAGYQAGAWRIDPEVKVLSNTIGMDSSAYLNPRRAKELSEWQYNAGVDIIYHAAGASGIGVMEAARDRNRWMIGVDADQSLTAPEGMQPYILTSMLKRVDVAVFESIRMAVQGAIHGGNILLGLREDAVGYAENEFNRERMAPIRERIESIRAEIIEGKIKAPGWLGE
ncbi:BMP family ABC transporter substrate-binding protein [Heliobacterium gestii]|uniref:BMP family ABC transporter substrate-binding protein n=1 Tax=Heliomicrobium gestii TaxID=2699 RepID=A0A845LK41_HELGE|nr:BMP family ABC transporter substrate-binding protein [Heliomicrobium gestii]MBM7866493.1 basic membrane protein A [Heliomicrobium gestii]MZP43226.1 BMP family ABC transporter substrate-binding protein [Heliomicrobium gestii]